MVIPVTLMLLCAVCVTVGLIDVKKEFALQNGLSCVYFSCPIKKGNDFNNSMFSVHNQVEI